ncbi:MAG: diacylglycerol kinase family protein [Gemmataceae bacterium]
MGECVIYNPAAGRGRAKNLIAELTRRYPGRFDLRPTTAPGHGTDLALNAIADGCTTVIAAGGDGTVHEVAAGILQANEPAVVFGVWPVGSANDYAYALGIQSDWPLDDARRQAMSVRAVDVGRVTGGGRSMFFVNCLGIGFNSAVTLSARRIPWLTGMALYGLAFLHCVCRHFVSPTYAVTLDNTTADWPTLAFTLGLGKREGGFLVTPQASLDDGLFDYVHAGGLTRWKALTMLPKIATGTLPADHPLIRVGRCREATVRAAGPLRVHVDGEFFCLDDDDIHEVRVEVLPRRLRVLA